MRGGAAPGCERSRPPRRPATEVRHHVDLEHGRGRAPLSPAPSGVHTCRTASRAERTAHTLKRNSTTTRLTCVNVGASQHHPSTGFTTKYKKIRRRQRYPTSADVGPRMLEALAEQAPALTPDVTCLGTASVGEVGRDAAVGAVRRQTEEVLPDALQAGGAVVTTKTLTFWTSSRWLSRSGAEKKIAGSTRGTDRSGMPSLRAALQEPALEVLRLGIVEVERVVDRPGAVGTSEVPGGSVVLQSPQVALDLDQVQARRHRDQPVAC